LAAEEGESSMRLGVKEELCSGCRVCEVLCALVNRGECNPKLGAVRVKGLFPEPGRYQIALCDQCGECARVCPVEAITERNGVYRIDEELCTGCMECVEACPRDAMFAHPARKAPFKCIVCGQCVAYCPREAIYDVEGEVVRK